MSIGWSRLFPTGLERTPTHEGITLTVRHPPRLATCDMDRTPHVRIISRRTGMSLSALSLPSSAMHGHLLTQTLT